MSGGAARIVELDFLRGLMLVVMMTNHLVYFPLPSLFPYTYNWTFQPLGFASAAEGFVLLSGMLFGLVYGRKYALEGARRFNKLAARRAGTIYAHYLAAYFLIALLFSLQSFADAWPQNWESQEMLKREPWAMFLRGAAFAHQTGLLDILPMYCIFVALAIPAMHLLAAGRWKMLLAASCLLWLAGQARPQLYLEMRTGLHLGWFELAAWQLPFVAGLVFGWFRARNPAFRPPLSARYVIAAAAVFLPLLIYRHQFSLPEDEIPNPAFFDARNLGAVRLLNTAALAYLVYALAKWLPRGFRGGVLADIGVAALRVFCWHVLVCYAAAPFREELGELQVAMQIAVWAALVASLYLPAFAEKRLLSFRRTAKPAG